jgi:CPA2 family monovalent cation:H+ antiporter-2
MAHNTFITTVVISLVFAYTGGLVARLLRLPNMIGYLAAGVLLGPHTPGFNADSYSSGFNADQELTAELAEIGVALLMFKIGLHFSIRDLITVWHVAVPGALAQISMSMLIGTAAGMLLGWQLPASVVLGLAIAISSTAVATRALEDRQLLSADVGRVVLGWLVVQDLVVIAALILLPVIAHGTTDLVALGWLIGKTLAMIGVFSVILFVIGQWLLPALLGFTARIGSHELFTLGVVVIALGVAFGLSKALGMSLALGAFFAGLVLGESELSHQAAAESLPIQNIFTVLFFISVGMMFDPSLVLNSSLEMGAILVAIILSGGMIFFGLALLFRVRPKSAGVTAGILAQVGEFSFILTSLAVAQTLMTQKQQGLLLAAAILSILLHSITIAAFRSLGSSLDKYLFTFSRRRIAVLKARAHAAGLSSLRDHTIIVGYGRVGRLVAAALRRAELKFAVIEGEWQTAKLGGEAGDQVVFGDATQRAVLRAARPSHARVVVVALPDAFQTRRVIELAQKANPAICIVARAHSDEEYQYLRDHGAGLVVMGEREIALGMSDHVLQKMEMSPADAQAIIDALRTHIVGPLDRQELMKSES